MSSTTQTLRPQDLLEHLEWMHRLARALTNGDAAEAEDLAEDAVEAALANPPRLLGPVRPWLAGVLRNLARMRARSGARQRRRHVAALVDDEVAPSPAELAERVEAQRLVALLVLRLEEPFRSTLLLRYSEGLSAAAVAHRLGVPAGTVRWRIKHALDQLRVELDRAHGGERERWHALLLPLPLKPLLRAPTTEAPQAASGPGAPARARGASGVSIAGQPIVAAICILLLAIGSVCGILALVHSLRRGAAPLAETAARRPWGWVAHRSPLDTSLLANPPSDPAAGPAPGLRLEGQVIDDALEDPVGGATVAIDTDPPRTVVTRPDGGFVLEGLMPRAYRLEARTTTLYAGIAEMRLSQTSEPIILRAIPGSRPRLVVRAASDGRPIAGAHVMLRSILSWEARTGADGAVAFAGVSYGWPQARVEAAGFAPFHRTMVPNDPNAQSVWEIRLESGAPVDGRVVDARGAAVAGALVWASPTSELLPTDDPRQNAVTTDDDGRWKIPALAAGTYRFEASHPGHVQGATAPTAINGSGAGAPVNIRLEAGGTVTGEVRDADGKPVASVQVRVAPNVPMGRRYPRDEFTDSSGRFRSQGLPRQAIDVVALGSEASSPTVAVDLRTGAADRHVVLVMSNDRSITGTVVDGAGQPIGEAQVVAEPDRGSSGWAETDWELRGLLRFVSDGGGHFRFAGLPAGNYRLRAGHAAGSDMLVPFEGMSAKPGDRDVRIVVRRRGSVKGTVLYEDGGAPPVFGVTVGTVTREFSGSIGGGSFTMDVPASHADLVVWGSTFANARAPGIDITEDKSTDVGVVKVKRGRNVSGRVLRADGTPVAAADVAAGPFLAGDGRKFENRPGIRAIRETRSGDDGRYSMRLDDAELVVVAESPGVGRSRVVAIHRGEISHDIDLIIGATGMLHGVVSRDGKPLANVPVAAAPSGTPTAQFVVMSGPDGAFEFDVLAPGPYRVIVEDGVGTPNPRGLFSNSVTVAEGRDARLDIDIPMGPHTLTVDVKTEQGDAVPGARILAVACGGGEISRLKDLFDRFYTCPDGPASLHTGSEQPAGSSMQIAGLVPGTYAICTANSWIPPDRPDGPEDPVRCVVQRVGSSQTVSLAIPTSWVRR